MKRELITRTVLNVTKKYLWQDESKVPDFDTLEELETYFNEWFSGEYPVICIYNGTTHKQVTEKEYLTIKELAFQTVKQAWEEQKKHEICGTN